MSNPCAKCNRKPAFWHRQTLTWLCGGCTSEYNRRFRAELEADLAERPTSPAIWMLYAVVACAVFWAWLVVLLGVAP